MRLTGAGAGVGYDCAIALWTFAAMMSEMLKVRDECIRRILARSSDMGKGCIGFKSWRSNSQYTRLGEWKWNAQEGADVALAEIISDVLPVRLDGFLGRERFAV